MQRRILISIISMALVGTSLASEQEKTRISAARESVREQSKPARPRPNVRPTKPVISEHVLSRPAPKPIETKPLSTSISTKPQAEVKPSQQRPRPTPAQKPRPSSSRPSASEKPHKPVQSDRPQKPARPQQKPTQARPPRETEQKPKPKPAHVQQLIQSAGLINQLPKPKVTDEQTVATQSQASLKPSDVAQVVDAQVLDQQLPQKPKPHASPRPRPMGKPHIFTSNIVYDEDGNQFDYSTMSMRFNPVVHSISSKVTHVDTQITELNEKIENRLGFIDDLGPKLTSECHQLNESAQHRHTLLREELPSVINAHTEQCKTALQESLATLDGKVEKNADALVDVALDLEVHSHRLHTQIPQQVNAHVDTRHAELQTSLHNLDDQLKDYNTTLKGVVPSLETEVPNRVNAHVDTRHAQLQESLHDLDAHVDTRHLQLQAALSDLDTQLHGCGSSLKEIVPFVENSRASLDQELQVIKSKIEHPAGARVMIEGPAVIETPGDYCLAQNFVAEKGVGIMIRANNVTLDLNGKMMVGDGAEYGIVVTPAAARTVIKNGNIQNMKTGAIMLQADACLVEDCTYIGNTVGMIFEGASNCIVNNCSAMVSAEAGFALLNNSIFNVLKNCKAISTGEMSNAFGFISSGGVGNTFENCLAENTQTMQSEGAVAAGFALIDGETSSKLIGNKVSNTTIPEKGSSSAYGILLETQFDGNFAPSFNKLTLAQNASVLDWSPDNRFLAVANNTPEGGMLEIYNYNGSALIFNGSVNYGPGMISDVKWSHSGKFIALTFNGIGTPLIVVPVNNGVIDTHDDVVKSLSTQGTLKAVAWSFDDAYIAVGAHAIGMEKRLHVFKFDGGSLQLIGSDSYSSAASGGIYSLAWHPHKYIVAAAGTSSVQGHRITQYAYDNATLSNLGGDSAVSDIKTLGWSPSGELLVAGSSSGLYVYKAQESNLESLDSVLGVAIDALAWSCDGQHIVCAASSPSSLIMYQWHENKLVVKKSAAQNVPFASLSWSPCAQYFAAAVPNNDADIRIFTCEIDGVKKAVVKNNTVSATRGGNTMSVGMSACSNKNFIDQNSSFDNDINYRFVQQVGNGYAESTGIKNISV